MTVSRVCTPASVSALRLVEESAAGLYLEARRAMVDLGARVVSVGRLVAEHPDRADYLRSHIRLHLAYEVAAERCDRAWRVWQQAQRRTDTEWTATTGRARIAA